jgi:PAS domain S-box-containing protein
MAVSSGFSPWLILLIVSASILVVALAIASYRFWNQARQRSASLEELNNTLNYHLEQERALRYINERFLEFSRDILCSISADGTFLQISPACLTILGYSPEELQGQPYRQLLVPEDRASTEDEMARLISGEHDKAIEFRARLNHRNGQVITIAWIAEWSPEDQILFCVGRDISNELVAEILTQEREQFFSLSPDMFCIVDLNSYFFELNAHFVDTLGYTRDELLGTSYLDLIHEDDREAVQEAMWALGEGAEIKDLEVRILNRQGGIHWVDINAILSADDLIYVVARDTTALRKAMEQLEETMKELERSNRELQDFAFVASHDLQEPLRKIQAFSDRLIARSEDLGEREKDYLRRMQSAAGRMQALIEDLLSYSRVTTRAKPMVACNTNEILSEVLVDMETSIGRAQGKVDAETLPATWGDAMQLRQVLQNLLSNAIKFHAPDRSPVVQVRAEDITNDAWTLVVSDNGIGFDERYAEKLFHPFQRLHQKEGYPGTGIGMAIVKKILDRHGASVSLNSQPGTGTTFRIRLRSGQGAA